MAIRHRYQATIVRSLLASVLLLGAVLLGLTSPQRAGAALPAGSGAAVTCSSIGISLTSVQTPRFYMDAADNFYSAYVGYRVENQSASTAITKPWVRLEGFTGVVGKASGEPGRVPMDVGGAYTLAANAVDTAFFYLTASAASVAASSHEVALYSGKPGVGGQPVCRESFSMVTTEDTIAANANKVTGMSGVPTSVDLGSTFQFTVDGDTGTLGAGPAFDLGLIRFSPSTVANFPSNAFRLVGVEFTLGGITTSQRLALNNQVNGGLYDVTYTYQAVGATSTATTILPVQYIASGTQIKHTGSFSGTTAIPAVSNQLTMTGSGSNPGGGDPASITATVNNAGTSAVAVDDVEVTIPAGWTYDAGSVTACGASSDEPVITGSVLTFVGPFAVPAGGACGIDFDLTPTGVGTATAIAHLADSQIDTTVPMGDNAPVVINLGGAAPVIPDAVDDSATIPMTAAADIDVLANDTVGGAAVVPASTSVTVTSGPTNGGVSVLGSGRLRYTPNAGYSGSDSITYQVDVAGQVDTATLTINVLPAPVAMNDAVGTLQSSAVNVDVLGNDTVAGSALSPAAATLTIATAPGNGVAAITGSKQASYTPNAGFVGVDTFDYTVTVNGQASTARATVTVSPATPVANVDTATLLQGASTDVDVIANDTVAGAPAALGASTIAVATPPVNGLASVVGGKVRYAPNSGYVGPDTMTYTITVNGVAGTGTVNLTVNPVAPVAVGDSTSLVQGSSSDVDVIANDTVAGTPAPAGIATLLVATPPAHGTATIVAGKVRYASSPNYSGPDSLVYSITINGVTSSATVNLTVTPAAPVAAADVATVDQGASTDIDVIANDTVAGLPATSGSSAVAIASPPSNGTAAVIGTRIRYTPAPGYVGPDAMTYTITVNGVASTGTITLTSAPVTPVAGDDVASTPQAVPVNVAPLGNDLVAGRLVAPDTAAVAVVAPPAHGTVSVVAGGQVRYSPSSTFHGVDQFTYSVTVNGLAATAAVRVTVLPAPVAAPETTSTVFGNSVVIDVLGNDTTGGLPASFSITTLPRHGTLEIIDGRVVYVPAPGYAGADSFEYVLVTAGGSTTGRVSLDVTPVLPGPPRDVTATRTATGTLTVTWTRPASDGGSPITGYVVRDADGHVVCRVPAGRTACTAAGAVAFRGPFDVSATSGVGTSTKVVTRPSAGGEGPPSDVESLPGRGVVLIGWVAPAKRTGLVGYEVLVDGTVRCRTQALRCTVRASNNVRHVIDVRAVYPSRSLPARGIIRSGAPLRQGTLQLVVHFGFDSSDIPAADLRRIEAFTRLARKVGVKRMTLTGNTDSVGSHSYNVALSARRAVAVQREVTNRIPGVRLKLDWRSEEAPVAGNSTDRGRHLNRRVNATLIR